MLPTTDAEAAAPPRVHRHWWDPGWNRATWILFFVFIIPVIGGMIWIGMAANGQTKVEPVTQRLAAQLAGGPVQPFQGTEHTVYQATAPLPTAAHPRSDGRLTLAWMSGTNCGNCGKMDDFAWQTLEGYASKAVIMEKDLGRQPIDARYGVTSAPAFIVLSPTGDVLARFSWQPTATALKQAIDQALTTAGGGNSAQ
ncbi:MAG TPA: hypothetical protein VG672_10830 [Bryobacteraceae bacterium]|nr:hypothetical protein [Bryobacteraceae bacterium]